LRVGRVGKGNWGGNMKGFGGKRGVEKKRTKNGPKNQVHPTTQLDKG